MIKNIPLINNCHIAGLAVLLIGVLLQLADVNYALIVYSVGAVIILLSRFLLSKTVSSYDVNEKRKYKLFIFSAICFVLGAVAIHYRRNYWIVLVLAASVVDIYMTFRIDETKK